MGLSLNSKQAFSFAQFQSTLDTNQKEDPYSNYRYCAISRSRQKKTNNMLSETFAGDMCQQTKATNGSPFS